MTTPPAISGCSGRSMPCGRTPRWSSQTATTTAATTTSMNAVFQNTSERDDQRDQDDGAGDRGRQVAAGAAVVFGRPVSPARR